MDQETQTPKPDQQAMLEEILKHTRATKNYMKWQLIITIALVVIPLIATLVMIPLVLHNLQGLYPTGGLLQ